MPAPLVGLAVGAAARAVAKKVASNAVKKAVTKKAVAKTTKVATKAKEAAKTAKIAKNSVKTTPPQKAAVRLEKNSMSKAKADTAKTGAMARYYAGQVEKTRQLPSKVIKINSAANKKGSK
jgi:hypothetical protein